jgi:hypothetical protein
MTPPPRLGVYLTPSPCETAWTEALTATATSAGWLVMAGTPPAAVGPGTGPGTLSLATSGAGVAASQAVDWLVIGDRPAAALAAVMSAAGGDRTAPALSSAIWHTAQRFATASTLALGGARVLDATARTLDLPGLGSIHRADAATVTPVATTALDVYLTVPPAAGARAIWPTDLFTYPAGRTIDRPLQIDLTGRPRVLVFGPYIDLPAGNWRATIRISADPEGGRIRLRLEWGQGEGMTATSVTIRAPGHYAVSLEQGWLGQGPAEVRIWLEEASFGGRLTLVDVEVDRL